MLKIGELERNDNPGWARGTVTCYLVIQCDDTDNDNIKTNVWDSI